MTRYVQVVHLQVVGTRSFQALFSRRRQTSRKHVKSHLVQSNGGLFTESPVTARNEYVSLVIVTNSYFWKKFLCKETKEQQNKCTGKQRGEQTLRRHLFCLFSCPPQARDVVLFTYK